jgi:hypothetical protein
VLGPIDGVQSCNRLSILLSDFTHLLLQ